MVLMSTVYYAFGRGQIHHHTRTQRQTRRLDQLLQARKGLELVAVVHRIWIH